jgi:hypothetical protein
MTSRYRTWHFSHILHTSLLPQASSGLAPSNNSTETPEDTILRLFQDMLLTDGMPDCVVYIHLRVSRSAFDSCVSCGKAQAPLPDLPFTGYMQAAQAIDLQRLKKWFDMKWDPVGAKLGSHGPYLRDFLHPDRATAAAYVCFSVHGVAALGKGGRPPQRRGLPKDSAVNHYPASIREFQTIAAVLPCIHP